MTDLGHQTVSLREHLEALIDDLVARWLQRWTDHDHIHDRDQTALTEALSRTERAIELALVSHRREHEIERTASTEADAAHQLRHEQMNEIRQQLSDQAATFARQDVLTASLGDRDRRMDEMRAEHLAYRDQVRVEILAVRDTLQIEIASLRESRSQGMGIAEQMGTHRLQSNWSTGLMVAVGFSTVAALVSIAGLILALTRHP